MCPAVFSGCSHNLCTEYIPQIATIPQSKDRERANKEKELRLDLPEADGDVAANDKPSPKASPRAPATPTSPERSEEPDLTRRRKGFLQQLRRSKKFMRHSEGAPESATSCGPIRSSDVSVSALTPGTGTGMGQEVVDPRPLHVWIPPSGEGGVCGASLTRLPDGRLVFPLSVPITVRRKHVNAGDRNVYIDVSTRLPYGLQTADASGTATSPFLTVRSLPLAVRSVHHV
jgi:hypothetical protein